MPERFSGSYAMPTRRLTLVVGAAQVAIAALILGVIELVIFYSGAAPPEGWVAALFVVVAWVYAGAGVVALLRRPGSLMGLLMTAGSFAWLLSALTNTHVEALVALGLVFTTVPLALVIHLLLAFPSGRLRTRAARLITIAAYLLALVGQAPLYLFAAEGPLSVAARPDLAAAGHTAGRSIGGLLVLSTAVLLARRLRALPPAQQRVLAPLSIYGILAVLLIPVSSALTQLFSDPVTHTVIQLCMLGLVPVAFLIAAQRGGFAHTGEVEKLGTLLGDGGRGELADLLRATLGDSTVRLLFRVPGEQGWVNSAGVAEIPPAAGGDRGVVEVALAGETIGAIAYDATLLSRPDEVRDAARVVGLALDRERLAVELRASRARLVEAGDTERRRIAQDLHDGLQSRLVLLAVQAGVDRGSKAELREGIELAIDELRALVNGVMPSALTERGLPAAVKGLADRIPIDVELEIAGFEERPPPALESTAFFVTAEAMINAVKHAHANRLTVSLVRGPERLAIDVRDDGIGGANGTGNGIRSMTDRVEALGGELRTKSALGAGTLVHVELPCAS